VTYVVMYEMISGIADCRDIGTIADIEPDAERRDPRQGYRPKREKT
jgi:hypothetical protein